MISHSSAIAIQLFGAALILLAFWANASGRWSRESPAYLWINFIGSLFLGFAAFFPIQPGFILLETVWAAISLFGLWQHWRNSQKLCDE